ncbi:MAG: hypothetical protein ABSE95_03140 [Thermodesulfobacteriota bacterium]
MKSNSIVPRLLVLIVALIVSIATSRADELRALPDDNLAYPVLLISEPVDGRSNTGSGFYYDDGKALYFVTARHVLFSETSAKIDVLPRELGIPYHLLYRLYYDVEKKELHFAGVMSEKDKAELISSAPKQALFKQAVEQLFKNSQTLGLKNKTAILFSYPKERGKGENNELELQLEKLLNEGRIKYHQSDDVAAVKMGTTIPTQEGMEHIKLSDGVNQEGMKIIKLSDGVTVIKGSGILSIDGTKNIKLFNDVLEGNSVFMFGYPMSISKDNSFLDIKLPLLRKGIVAGKNDRLRTIILDCPIYQGNSGGLVIEVDEKFGQKYFKGIGLITNFVPFNSEGSQNAQNSGYSIAVPMDPIVELLKD